MAVRRGGIVESVHEIYASVLSDDGEILALGNPDTVTFLRSSAKPFQTTGFLLSGARDAFDIKEADIALITASHSGEPIHTERVAELLAMAGLGPEHLLCGAHIPYDEETARTLSGPPTALHSNCSGKHTGMLLQAVHEKLDLQYLPAEHPIQVRNRAVVATFAGMAPEELGVGVDGCGVPNFALPIRKMAEAYRRLARPDGVPEAMGRASVEVLRAMTRHPRLVDGRGRFGNNLMTAFRGRLAAKGGAEGVFCAVFPEDGTALALKVADGSPRPIPTAVVAILKHLGLDRRADTALLDPLGAVAVKNVAGRVVGDMEMHFEEV